MQFKLIYLARRNPAVSEADWPRIWRSHAVFASQFPSIGAAITSLFYCTRMVEPTLDGARFDPSGVSREHDGVAVVAADSQEALNGQLTPEDRARIYEDELRVFNTTSPNFSFFCQESLVYGGAPGQAAVIRFLARKSDMPAEEFAERWRREHGNLVTRAAGVAGTVTRYVHNSPVAEPPADYPIDGISETWFASGEDAVRSFADEAFAPVEKDLGEFCDLERSITMLTEVFYRWPKA